MTFDEASGTAEQIRAVYGHLGVSATINAEFVPLDQGYCIDLSRPVDAHGKDRRCFFKRLWLYPADVVGGLNTVMDLWFRQMNERSHPKTTVDAPMRLSCVRFAQDSGLHSAHPDLIAWEARGIRREIRQDARYGPLVREITRVGHIVAQDTEIERIPWLNATRITVTVYDGGSIEEEVPPPF